MAKKPSEAARALARLGARKGGKARASVLTDVERKEIARKAVTARWAKEKGPGYVPPAKEGPVASKRPKTVSDASGKLPYSMFRGVLHIGALEAEAHVLSDGRRVFTQREMVRLISGGRESGNLRPYLEAIGLWDSGLDAGEIAQFTIPSQPTLGIGYEATLLIEICEAYLAARDRDGGLMAGQRHLAKQAEVIIRACAKVGIIALIDEATGYQKVRAERALQMKLQAFIAEDLQEWVRTFPEDFWIELARMEGVHYSPRSRPIRWGKYVMVFVYDALDKDVGKRLREINPNPHHRMNHHQWLKEFGKEKLNNHLQQVVTVMKLCDNMEDFKKKFARVFKKSALQITFDDIDWGAAN